MKIKEKGLSGKAANHRRELIAHGKGFDAFREMAKERKASGKGEKKEEKKDVFLEFMGTKILIHRDEEGFGCVKEEDVPLVKGATLKFDGCGGDVIWSEIKVCACVADMYKWLHPFVDGLRIGSHQGKV
jgi:lupus La protein